MTTASYFHCAGKPIKRSENRSAVACAAYRTGAKLVDHYYGDAIRDFSRKKDVVASFTLAPEGAPAWATDAEALWNAVEYRETRAKSQLALEWEIALPNELTDEQREALARKFTQWLVDEYGVAVTTGIHSGGERGNGLNDHMHVMMTLREIGPEGWAKNKLRDFNVKPGTPNPEFDKVREQAATLINEALEAAGSDDTVDHRSFKARGIYDREPTTHLGPAATARERRHADQSDRGDLNRAILEDRIAWQHAQAEISADIEHELSARFEGWQPLTHGVEIHTAPPIERGAPADTSEAGSGWRRFGERVRAFQAKALEFFRDETSGAPEAERGLAARLVDAGRKLWAARSHHDGQAFAEGLEEAAAIAGDPSGKHAGGSPHPSAKPPKTWAQRVREGLTGVFHDTHGSGAGIGHSGPQSDFKRMVEDWAAEAAPGRAAQPPPPNMPQETHPPEHGAPDIEP